jgi:hypothetical protein
MRCGEPKVHAHHEDYSRPLDVTWLCQKCHVQRHVELGWGIPWRPDILRRPIALTLRPELVAHLDAIAAGLERSRVKVIEFACREYVQAHQRKAAP